MLAGTLTIWAHSLVQSLIHRYLTSLQYVTINYNTISIKKLSYVTIKILSQAGTAQLVEYSPLVPQVSCLIPLMPGHMYMEEIGLTDMLATKRSACVTPEVNLREHVTHAPLPGVNKAAQGGVTSSLK